MACPHRTSGSVHVVLAACARADADTCNRVVLDNRRCHTAKRVIVPDKVAVVFVPPYSPELHPIERVWRDLKDQLAWQHVADVDTQQQYVGALMRGYDGAKAPIFDGLHLLR